MISSNLEQKYKSIILTNFFSKLYEIQESHKNQFSRRIGRNHSSVVANIRDLSKIVVFFSISGFDSSGFLSISNSRFHQGRFIPVTILIESFRKHPSRVNFHPFAGLSRYWLALLVKLCPSHASTIVQKNRHLPDKSGRL